MQQPPPQPVQQQAPHGDILSLKNELSRITAERDAYKTKFENSNQHYQDQIKELEFENQNHGRHKKIAEDHFKLKEKELKMRYEAQIQELEEEIQANFGAAEVGNVIQQTISQNKVANTFAGLRKQVEAMENQKEAYARQVLECERKMSELTQEYARTMNTSFINREIEIVKPIIKWVEKIDFSKAGYGELLAELDGFSPEEIRKIMHDNADALITPRPASAA